YSGERRVQRSRAGRRQRPDPPSVPPLRELRIYLERHVFELSRPAGEVRAPYLGGIVVPRLVYVLKEPLERSDAFDRWTLGLRDRAIRIPRPAHVLAGVRLRAADRKG